MSSYQALYAVRSVSGARPIKSSQSNVSAMDDESDGGNGMDGENESGQGAAIAAEANARDDQELLRAIRDEDAQRRKNRYRPSGQKPQPKSMLIDIIA